MAKTALVTAQESSSHLESAKERLRTALTHLENVVERKLKEARAASAEAPRDEAAQMALRDRFEKTANENGRLRAENEKLAGLHAAITKRVDKLIQEVRQVVGK